MMNLSATIIIAIYGAVLSTITAAIQLSSHFRDRAKIRLKMRKNMATVGMGRGYAGMTMVIITATNVGRRPVTIAGFAAELLYGKQEYDAWHLQDVKPQLPCEITEGHEVSAFVNQKNVSFDVIASWYAWDTTGRKYHLNLAPWYIRWMSHYRRKRAGREKSMLKKAEGNRAGSGRV